MDRIEPIAARIPYMTCVGNHGNNQTNQSDLTTKTDKSAFHSTQNFGLNFRKLLLTKFSEISVKENNLENYTQILRIFFFWEFCTFWFSPEFLEFSVECFAFRKFDNFRVFWELSGKFWYYLASLHNFGIFGKRLEFCGWFCLFS